MRDSTLHTEEPMDRMEKRSVRPALPTEPPNGPAPMPPPGPARSGLRTDPLDIDPTTGESAEINRRFTYHPPRDGQPELYQALRDEAQHLAYTICEACPASRERSSAITALEEAVMWANAAIARRGP